MDPTEGPFDLVIFDMDGVLVDSELISARVTASALNEAGAPVSEADLLERFLGMSTSSILEKVALEHECRFEASFQDTLRARVLEAFERELRPVPGVPAMLDALGVRRCVASSSHPDRIRRSLEIAGLLDRLAPHLFSATMVARGKPAPDLFVFAASEMGVTPARCVVVEDSAAGVLAAKAAGMTALGFTGGSHVDPETHGSRLLAAGADAVLTRMTGFADSARSVAANV